MVQGTLTGLENQAVRIDAALANIKTVQRNDAAKVSGSLLEFYQLEKNLAFDVIDAMGIALSRERKKLFKKCRRKTCWRLWRFAADWSRWISAIGNRPSRNLPLP